MSTAYSPPAVAPLGTYRPLLRGTSVVECVLGSVIGSSQQSYGGVHRGGHVPVGRVEQRAADDQALHGGQLERAAPLLVRALLVLPDVSAEQYGGQGGGRHDPGHVVRVVGDGHLQPGVRRTAAQATGDGDGLDDGLGAQVVDQRAPGGAAAEERFDED